MPNEHMPVGHVLCTQCHCIVEAQMRAAYMRIFTFCIHAHLAYVQQ